MLPSPGIIVFCIVAMIITFDVVIVIVAILCCLVSLISVTVHI